MPRTPKKAKRTLKTVTLKETTRRRGRPAYRVRVQAEPPPEEHVE